MTVPTPIWRLQAHYFAIYAVFGSVTPYLPIYLRDNKGISPADMGFIFAVGQGSVLLMPVLITFLADRYRLVRPLLIGLFLINIVAMTALTSAVGFWLCLTWIAINRLALQPQLALGDGLYFTLQADPTQPRSSYPMIRVWGAIGFIIPSVVMFAVYQAGGDVTWLPPITALFALAGIANSLGLPVRSPVPETTAKARVPTWEAAKVLARPPLALFCLGVGFVIFSNMAFYTFYPLYLTQQVGFAEKWVGPISSLGVGLEVLYILGLDRMKRRFGYEGIMALGSAASVFRLTCLGFLPTPFFAVFFQLFHGMTILGFMILPVMYLNSHAGAGYRNSIQGLFVMLSSGVFAIAGHIFAGQVAEIGLLTLFRASLAVCLLGVVLTGLSFWCARRTPPPPAPTT